MKKRWFSGVACFLTIVLGFCGCAAQGDETKMSVNQGMSTDNYGSVLKGEITEAVANIKTKEVDYNKAVYVNLEGLKATITSIGNVGTNTEIGQTATNGLSLKDGVLSIETAGDYVLQGQFEGQVLVNADKEDKVHLVLNGVSISCQNSSAIYGQQSDRIYITLAEGTVNTVSDGSVYLYQEEGQEEPNAAIFSKDDLTFDGTGSLVVKGNYKDGIRSKDDLAVVDGNYEIEAVGDGLQGKDSVCITNGNFIIKATQDAIKSSNDTEEEKGYVVINGGTFSIQAGDDGVHGESGLLINDCKMDILSSYEGLEAMVVEINGGDISLVAKDDGLNAAGGSDATDAFFGRGMMEGNADCKIAINGGSLKITADGDGIDSNGGLYVTGGMTYVNGSTNNGNGALDYGTEATVSGGIFLAVGASGMALGFSESSTQCHIFYNLQSQAAAGELLNLLDEEGKEILSFTPERKYNSVVISCPEMVADGTYTLNCGGIETEITLNGNAYSVGEFGGFGGGQGGFGGGRGDFGGRGEGGQGDFGGFGGGQGDFGGDRGNRWQEGEMPKMPEDLTPPEGWEEGQMPDMPEGMTP